jgi:hypothetical protein
VRPVWLKAAVISLPFLALVTDVAAWYVTKVYHPFAWVVMAAGGVTGMCFAFMWFVSMWQMWVGKTPRHVAERMLHSPDLATNVG